MIVKIEKQDIEALRETCAIFSCQLRVFTMETNDQMVQVEILENDYREIDPKSVWHLRGVFQSRIELHQLRK
jgi:hypothetical protein